MTTTAGRFGRRISFLVLSVLMVLGARSASAVTVPGNYSTIQAAINAVISGAIPNGTTIDVQPGIYSEALVISNTAKSLTLRGVSGAGVTFVDATGKGAPPVWVYRATGTIVISGLNFRHGAVSATGGGFRVQESSPSFVNCIFELNTASDGGGGSLVTSNATFAGCSIRNNSAARYGGGVYISTGSRPVFTTCDIFSNGSGTGSPSIGANGAGGGVHSSDSSPTFHSSRILSNTGKFAAGGIYHYGVFGSPYGTATLQVFDSEVSDNVANAYSTSHPPAEGGGIHIEDNATAVLTRVRVLRNQANTGGGLSAYRARYDIFDSVIDSNQATGRSDGGIGGGIDASSTNVTSPARPPSIVNLTGTLVRNNVGITGGGIVVTGDVGLTATLTLVNSVVDGNQSQNQGGGILLSRTYMAATNSMITRNVVSGGGTAFGGGLLIGTSSSANITGTTLANNTAGIFGGAIFMDGIAALNMSTSNIYENTAGLRGGGLFVGGTGNQSGSIQNSIIADNGPSQINEDVCSSMTYSNNTVTPKAGTVVFTGCPGTPSRMVGTNSNVPRFAHFLAVPATGTSATLAWSVARASSVTISGVGSSNQPTGSWDVTVGSPTSYSLTAQTASGPIGPVAAGVAMPPTTLTHGVDGDFDGDRKSEITVFRGSTGQWFVRQSTTQTLVTLVWGGGADIPVPGDYDHDGKVDIAVFRPSTGQWFIRQSSTLTLVTLVWGGGADVPVPGDYDGDGKTDIAVFRRSTGEWFIRQSTTLTMLTLVWGGGADVAVQGDFDGDGKTDIAVFRPSTGQWLIRQSGTLTMVTLVWGGGTDISVPGDYDRDGKTDIAVFRPSTGEWFIRQSSTLTMITLVWGGGADIPVAGDYDGDGKTDIAVFRPSTGQWFVRQSTNFTMVTLVWGGGADIPILGR